MLKMIWCDKFIDDGQIREPIVFTNGLNTILGDGSHSNSIGKSSFLMIIDFCFGGEDYPKKETDTIDNIGHHTINFVFEFDGIEYHFSRSTDNPLYIKMYNDSSRSSYRTIHQNALREFLSRNYHCDNLNLHFRAIIGRFFRIYNRNTHNELRPLNATVREDEQSGIITMLKLFSLYNDIEAIKKAFDEANDKKRTFDNIRKYALGSIAISEDEYEANKIEIEKLKKELAILKEESKTGQSDNDIINAERKAFLKKERKKLRNQRRILEGKIDDIDFDDNYENKSFAKNLEKLMHFFPNESFEEITLIDKFHKDVKKIISKEMKINNEETLDAIALIDEQIKLIDFELSEYKTTPDVSEAVLERFGELNKKLHDLIEANNNYERHKNVVNDFKTNQKHLEEICNSRVAQLKNSINELMAILNLAIDGPNHHAPKLDINSLNSYSFYTPGDTGTGTRHKGVVVFDLAILNNTALPAVIHDSIMFNSVEYDRRLGILRQYLDNEKQIFVAYDDPDNANEEIKQILYDRKVIKLSKGVHALFGKQWA